MSVVLYLSETGGMAAGRLLAVSRSVVPSDRLEVFRNYRELTLRLGRLPKKISIGVLLAESRDQLLELVTLRSVLEDMRTILVVPDNEKVTIALAHMLRPTLLTCAAADADFADVAAVLAKCLA